MPSSMTPPPPPTHIPFSSLHNRPGLISLDAARQDPAIVYRSFDRRHPRRKQVVLLPLENAVKTAIRLVPLPVAQKRKSIKYRREGFEMQMHHRRILALRAER